MNHFFSYRNILRKSAKRFSEVLRIQCTFSLNIQFLIDFWAKFGPRLWDILSISGTVLMNHFFSILSILRKSAKRFREDLRIRCTFSLNIHFFIIIWPNFRPRLWNIYSISGNALMNQLFSILNILRKSAKLFSEVLRIRCTFSLNIQFFIMFGLSLGPDFEIFSRFQEMRWWITSLAS